MSHHRPLWVHVTSPPRTHASYTSPTASSGMRSGSPHRDVVEVVDAEGARRRETKASRRGQKVMAEAELIVRRASLEADLAREEAAEMRAMALGNPLPLPQPLPQPQPQPQPQPHPKPHASRTPNP